MKRRYSDRGQAFDGLHKLAGVDPRLISVLMFAAVDFYIEKQGRHWIRFTEGLRTPERQRELVRRGKSKTEKSYHLDGRAIDVAVMDVATGEPNWSLDLYRELNDKAQRRAEELSVVVTWGGHWKTLVDGVHFQLERTFVGNA